MSGLRLVDSFSFEAVTAAASAAFDALLTGFGELSTLMLDERINAWA
jgi:hypothetical protein